MMSFNAFFAKNLVSQNGNERQFVQETKKVALLERHNPNSTGIMMIEHQTLLLKISRKNTTCWAPSPQINDVNFGSDKTKNEASNANRHMSFSMYYTNEATVMPISQTFFSLHMFRENCFSLVSRMVPHMWLRSESRCLRIEWNLDLRGLEIHTEHLNSHPRDFSGWRLLPAVTVFT